ncbi:hypothetical protein VII00023_08724 [Vibrio ichthyoenteri ATCC 700023]|uniref:Uncharacterized protein n=1 Tax=Vibrio ichthyoenteri ATCC 700023 TaxID=870968 RepID=F9S5P6_9VIBR|nr:hypothetical protein [Vibrio ichthyoenteri]EGU35575.1 hypothetical protein VII00023_08724 [Vibrio ichthyoenteri ATCC 700023]
MNQHEQQPLTEDQALELIIGYIMDNDFYCTSEGNLGIKKSFKRAVSITEALDLLRDNMEELKEQGIIR